MEMCSGCGTVIEGVFPIGGVGLDQETGKYAVFSICEPCWRDPAHRKVPLKMHFFERKNAAYAATQAGRGHLG